MIDMKITRPQTEHWRATIDLLRCANLHAIGGIEMAEFPMGDCFIALCGQQPVGVAGYKLLDKVTAKHTLLVVHPDFRRRGIGLGLVRARFDYLRSQGIRRVYTNCDDPEVIRWHERHSGFRRTGELIPKQENFGRRDKDHWINLVVDL